MMKSFFAEPKSRIPLERLHKTTIKTEMNEDSKNKKNIDFSHNDYSERSDFIILSRAKRARSLLTARGLSQLRNSRLHK